MRSKYTAIFIAAITLVVYLLTMNSGTKPFVNSLFFLFIVVGGFGIFLWPFARKGIKSDFLQGLYFYTVFVAVLFWVGVTGWYYSPFFYFLYLIAIVIAFMFSSMATFLFVLVLMGLFAPNIGSIDFTVDIITIVSLFSVVPLTYFLQKEYLSLKQSEKKVLILEEEKKQGTNKVDEILLNKVVKFAVNVRQPVNDMKQLAHRSLKTARTSKDMRSALKKIAELGDISLEQIETFEENVTGRKLLHTRKKTKSKK